MKRIVVLTAATAVLLAGCQEEFPELDEQSAAATEPSIEMAVDSADTGADIGTDDPMTTEAERLGEGVVDLVQPAVEQDKWAHVGIRVAWEELTSSEQDEFCNAWNLGPDVKAEVISAFLSGDSPLTRDQVQSFFDGEC